MSNRVVCDISISADGFVAGKGQTIGAGERLFDGVPPLHLEQVAVRAASLVTHIDYRVLR
jgi:hypothetical protein